MTATGTRPRRFFGLTPTRWLLLAVAIYFAIAFALSWLRALEFQTTTWDQGLYQQALWTTAHGRPFYETADVETGGYGSLLEVHSVFLLYLVAPLYGALPYEATLLALQAAVVAAAAMPLFYLAMDVTGSPRLALLAGAAYLGWTPTLSSNLYDFHPEAFLPIEIFSLVLLWNRGRYAAGFAVALVAFLTFEFAPLIVFCVGLVSLFPWPEALGAAGGALTARLRRGLRSLARPWRDARIRASVALMAASAGAYGVLLWVRVALLPDLVPHPTLTSGVSGYVIGATPAALGLSLPNFGFGFEQKIVYWLVILGLLAFVPLLARRAMLLSVPWLVFTFFSANLNYVTLGFQYGFIAGSTLLVAFVFGLPRARRLVDALADRRASPAGAALRPRPAGRVAVLAAIAVLLAVNIALTPVNPALSNAGLGSAYRLSLTPPPGGGDVDALAALVPATATVVASDDLFPLVANDPNAYSFLWDPDPQLYLPFSFSDPPTYVLIAGDRTDAVLGWLSSALYDPAVYGVRAVVWSSSIGTVLLFEAGYRGAAQVLGPGLSAGGTFFGGTLAAGPVGVVARAAGSADAAVVENDPGAIGTEWYGPGLALPAGNYTITVSVRAQGIPGFPAPNATAPAVWIGAVAWAEPTFYGWSAPFGALDGAGFSTVEFDVSVPSPTIEFDLQGVVLDSSVEVTLNYIAVEAS